MLHYDRIAVFLYIITICLSFYMVVYFINRSRRNILFYSYMFIQAAIIIWSAGLIAEAIIPSSTHSLYWGIIKFYYSGICFIGFCWLFFCINYTEIKIKKIFIIALAILPTIFYIFLLTNDYHNLFYVISKHSPRKFGTVFWIHCFFVYLYILVGTFILIKHSLKNHGYKKKQTIAIIISGCIPLLSNTAYLYFKPPIEITPFSFIISLIILAIATFKYRFLNIVPISLLRFVDFIEQAILVLNENGRVENFNASFRNVFLGDFKLDNNDYAGTFVDYLRSRTLDLVSSEYILNAIESGTNSLVNGEICLAFPEYLYLYINIQPIIDKRGNMLGRVVSFTNVNNYKTILNELNDKNAELSVMNDQLQEYASKIEELAVIKERNRFARDVHDSVGHTMTLLISLLGVCKMTLKSNTNLTEEKLDEALKTAKSGLQEIRNSIKGLNYENIESVNIIKSIEALVENVKHSGVDIDFNIIGNAPYIGVHIRYALFRSCQEALTNAIRHGQATSIAILLQFEQGIVKLFIFDNGIGCKKINKGMGLLGMEDRVKDLGGTIVYGSDGELGFNIHIEIPLKEG